MKHKGFKFFIKDDEHHDYVKSVLSSFDFHDGSDCYENAKVVTLRYKSIPIYYSYATTDLSIDDLMEADIDDLAYLLEN